MLSLRGVKTYDTNRDGMSLHLISKIIYLGLCNYKIIDKQWHERELKFYKIAFNFSRYLRETGKLLNRYRELAIGYDTDPRFTEYNKVHKELFKKPLRRVNGRNVDFEALGHTLEKAALQNNIHVYIQWKSAGAYSEIERISLYEGKAQIQRSDEMDFPPEFYEKHFPNKGNPFSLSEDWMQ
jgi:hypothetical protein